MEEVSYISDLNHFPTAPLLTQEAHIPPQVCISALLLTYRIPPPSGHPTFLTGCACLPCFCLKKTVSLCTLSYRALVLQLPHQSSQQIFRVDFL